MCMESWKRRKSGEHLVRTLCTTFDTSTLSVTWLICKVLSEHAWSPSLDALWHDRRCHVHALKKSDTHSPSAFWPIAYLSTLYKCLLSIMSDKVYAHCEANKNLTEEQKGCRCNSRGCKGLLRIDIVVVKQKRKHQRNLYMAYIDYK